MQFKTTIDIPHSLFEISHAQNGIAIGSCFTTNIGNRLQAAKFPILVNPLGTVYNPVSVAQTIDLLLGEIPFDEQQIFFANGVWQSYYLHTSFSSVEKQEVLCSFNSVKNTFTKKFQNIEYLILTLGTAWIYELKESGLIVNNCHKTPASQFIRRKLSVDECVSVLETTISRLRKQNPDLQVIFTVSPIRHWKDGAHENQVSKSTLFLAIDELQKSTQNIHYFPAYELLMDDLRDYRFYDDDMLHPSATAIDYIWERFSETYFSAETQSLNQTIEKIQKALAHRPFNAESPEYKSFIEKTKVQCREIESQYPFIHFDN
ncbi:MAG: GSCFA domain-containing protein [Bacteroidales bacterium]|nr:GSCFA domain-containing protein [Bacteroidales bacterium]